MAFANDSAVIVINGVETPLSAITDRLVRAVIVSLFTWRRAGADDELSGSDPMGWWGDTWPSVANDRIGSRLWLLAREKVTAEVIERARGFLQEALAWMVEDKVLSEVTCTCQRVGLDGLGAVIQLVRGDGSKLSLRFDDLWSAIRHG